MKAYRFIPVVLLFLAAVSCRHETSREEDAGISDQPAGQYSAPPWCDPSHPDGHLAYGHTLAAIPDKNAEESAEAVARVKRDTLNGIAVRQAGLLDVSFIYEQAEKREAEKPMEFPYSYISTDQYLGVNFDNDIFNNTDYYYTNGIRFDFISPLFASSPFAYPMLPGGKASVSFHGMSIVQNMYTPTNPDTGLVIAGDRPFAAYLYFGHFKTSLNGEANHRLYSEIIIGLMGPGSLGGFMQKQIHSIEPAGWQNQIQNDFVLNYTAELEKGLINNEILDFNVFARGQAGTLYDNAGAGARMRLGRFLPYFGSLPLAPFRSREHHGRQQWQYGIFGSFEARLVAYNATLQGGMFNKNSTYTLTAAQLNNFLIQASAGFFIAAGALGISYEQFYISPEFAGGKHFRWGRIRLSYCFGS
jgi:hypothetical protein